VVIDPESPVPSSSPLPLRVSSSSSSVAAAARIPQSEGTPVRTKARRNSSSSTSVAPVEAPKSSSAAPVVLQLLAVEGPHDGDCFSLTAADSGVSVVYKKKKYVQFTVGRSDDAHVSLIKDDCVSEE